MTLFLRLLETPVSEKGAALEQAIAAYNRGAAPPEGVGLYERDPAAFRALPTTPFAYWADEAVFRAFQTLPPLDPGFDQAPDLAARLADPNATPAQRRKALRGLNTMLRRAWHFLTPEERARLTDALARLTRLLAPDAGEAPPDALLDAAEGLLKTQRRALAATYAETVVPTLLRYQTAKAQHGASTKNDFRFLRAWWEVDPETIGTTPEDTRQGRGWVHFAKGGAFSPFYADVHLVVDWTDEGDRIARYVLERYPYLDNAGWILHPENWYFRPGLTWPRRTNGLSFRVFSAGSIFADKGPVLFSLTDDAAFLSALVALTNSSAFYSLVAVQLAREELAQSFEVGLIQRVPIPRLDDATRARLAALGERGFHLQREADRADETTHVFTLPALLLAAARRGVRPPLPLPRELAEQARADEAQRRAALVALQREIDSLANALYGLNVPSSAEEKYAAPPPADAALAADLLMWAVGVAFGRWDLRLALEARLPDLPGPFAPLPRYAPAALRVAPGRPFPPFEDDPSDLPAFGLLADDPGQPWDLTGRVRRVLERLWGDRAPEAERQLLHMLGAQDLRAWLHHPNGFWKHHRTRYSKSRRKAPIYWPLQSERRAYTVWLYYPRLNRDLPYKALTELARPRLTRARRALEEARRAAGERPAPRVRRRLAALEAEVAELTTFVERLQTVAERHITPSLDDGVLLNAAPYHELLPWPEAARAWQDLRAGRYPWAHIAPQIPARG